MDNRKDFNVEKKQNLLDRNERLTAIAGAVLLILIVVELIITANLDEFISEHIFTGILLSGPLVVKLFSTGYRFTRYYTKSPEFIRKGPPNILLRLLAPFLVITTIVVIISGFGLVYFPDHNLLFKIHAASVAIWLPLLGVHIYAYLRKVPGLIARDWSKNLNDRVPGRVRRLGTNLVALIVGGVAAVLLTPWHPGRHGHGLPSPLVLGVVASIIAIMIAIPLLRMTNKVK